MTLKFHDFVEIEYTGRLEDGTAFDTTRPDIAKKNGIFNPKIKYENKIICVGEHQVLQGLDEDLIGKEINTAYTTKIPAEKAFGKKDIKKIKIVPVQIFKENNLQPYPGLQIDVDGELGVVNSISGGRVIVNFNHILAGKNIFYEYKILKIVDNLQEKITNYIHHITHIPKEALNVTTNTNGTTIQLPVLIPEPTLNTIKQKLTETTGATNITFTQKEIAK